MGKGKRIYLNKEETPMKWYWFNTHIRLPISLFMSFITIINMIGVTENASVIDIAYYVVHFVVLLVAEIGLLEYKKYGWISYIGALIIPVLYQSIAVVIYLLNDFDTSTIMPTLVSCIIFMICEGIYFWKRRFLFIPYESNSQDIKKESNDNMTSNDTMKAIMEMQAQETVKAMQANSKEQFGDEEASDFGLVPENPIYTHALKMVEGEREYLNKLLTTDGEKITWKRLGSTSAVGVNGMIDIYETFLPSGELYKNIYINMYGAKESEKAPDGFIMNVPKNIDTVEAEPAKIINQYQSSSIISKPQYVQPEKKSAQGKKTVAIICGVIGVVILCGTAFFVGYHFGYGESEAFYSKAIEELEDKCTNWEKQYNYVVNDYDGLVDDYDGLVNKYNNLVDQYNGLLDEYNALFKQKEEYDKFETLTFSGTGSGTIKGIKAPEGTYYITVTQKSDGYLSAHFFENLTVQFGDLVASIIDKGSETYGYKGSIDNGYINIDADGKWTVTIEKAE